MARKGARRKVHVRSQRAEQRNGAASASQWRRCYPLHFEKKDDEVTPVSQQFGDLTSLVNALRMRRIYRDASLRLLADLVYVARGELNRDGRLDGADGASDELEGDRHLVRRAAESSAVLFRSLRLRGRLSELEEAPSAHPVIVAQEDGLDAPVEILTQLLAASVARQFGEAAVAVTFAGAVATARVWIRHELVETTRFPSYTTMHAAVAEIVRARTGNDAQPFFHVLVAAAGTPNDIPDPFRAPPRPRWQDATRATPRALESFGPIPTGFDRIVYLTREVPDSAPEAWADLLGPGLRSRVPDSKRLDPQGPYFSSFIPTLVPPPSAPPRKEFDTEVADLELQEARRNRRTYPPGWRLRRDTCRLPIDLGELLRRWNRASIATAQDLQAFVDAELDNEEVRPHIERWARAATNRAVGVALSGGGASSYRLVPLLKGLDRSQVPVDILSGISGGAMLGAYYCASGLDGVETFMERGPRFQVTALTAVFRANRVRDLVDEDLKSLTVGQTDVRFLAIATALLERKPPETRIVTAGTLGEAVQASGAAPVLFVPVQVGNERFSDGVSAALLPARILKDWGADFVFAFNSLPGPLRRNPLDRSFIGRRLYESTCVSRIVDGWVSAGSMVQRLSREACEDAHVYFEPQGQDLFMIESSLFVLARRIARKLQDVEAAIVDCERTWRRLRLGGLTMGERPEEPDERGPSNGRGRSVHGRRRNPKGAPKRKQEEGGSRGRSTRG